MKKFLVLFLLIAFSLGLFASPVTLESAKSIAVNFYKNTTSKSKVVISDAITYQKDGLATFYVITFENGGFVIVSADDAVIPILGYSISSTFDKNNLPVAEENWLTSYSNYIKYIVDNHLGNVETLQKWGKIRNNEFEKSKQAVNPLCTTKWDQTCWYNELCPIDSVGPCGHAATGCVATAIAQVMKFWNYPIRGQGTHSYISQWHGVQSADFGATTYDWASMPDSLTSSNLAVATLMYHCGVSVDMNYYDHASGSNLYHTLTSLPNYFKYSNNIEFVDRSNYSDSAWIELMKSELSAGRPILYQGSDEVIPMSGHAWVCDGYDSNNFLHFNWGEGGDEGYYQIGNFMFNIHNEAVLKVMPIASCDIALRNFISPVPSMFLSPSTIKVRISNYDTLPHSNIPVSYRVDGGTPVNEIILLPIAALSDTVYEFTQPYDFSPNPGHVYHVEVYSSLACDAYNDNDSLSVFIENVNCVNPPYYMGFESTENINGWLTLNGNDDGNNWGIGPDGNNSLYGAHYSASSLPNDAWLISRCLQLETNKMYKLSYFYRGIGINYPSKLSVYIGNQQNVASMTTLLAKDTNILNLTYQKKEIYFTVPESGSYFIGWYPEDNSLSLDDINITEQTAIDVGLVATNLPDESCDLQMENIVVTVKNLCSTMLTNIPVSYSLNGGTPVNDTITTPIAMGDTLVYTFGTPVDLSANGQYNIKIYTSLPGDTIYDNDTITKNVINHISLTPYYTMGFEPSDDFSGWKIYNNNNDAYTWTIQTAGGYTQPYCIRYDYSSWLPADDWFVSPCINLSASQNYKLTFWYKVESHQFPEKLKVFIGDGQDMVSLATQLFDFPDIINSNYQKAETIFNIPTDGLYYIGWHCYSDATMFNLYVDDISIDFATAKNNHEYNLAYQVFPNPFKDEVIVEHFTISTEEVKYEISNVSGKQIMQIFSKNNKVSIPTGDLSKGVYILKITSNNGVVVKKLIKE